MLTSLNPRTTKTLWTGFAIDSDDRILTVTCYDEESAAKLNVDNSYILVNFNILSRDDGYYVRLNTETKVRIFIP